MAIVRLVRAARGARRWLAAALFGAALPAVAQEAPDAMVKRVAQDVLRRSRSDPAIQAGNEARIREVIEAKLLPNFDFARMTALAMGRNWRSATPEQQKRLTDEFRALLVRTYSGALNQYRNETIDYKPLRMNAGDTDVTVRTLVQRASGRPGPDRLRHGEEGGRLEVLRRHRRRRLARHQLSRRVQRADQERRRRRPHQDARRPQPGRRGEMSAARATRGVAAERRASRRTRDGARWTYAGALTFANAGAVLAARGGAAAAGRRRASTCAGRRRAIDSAAVAVLLALKRRAADEGRPLRVRRRSRRRSPRSRELYGVEEILGA